MTSEARARLEDEEEATATAAAAPEPGDESTDAGGPGDSDSAEDDPRDDDGGAGRRRSPVVPVLAVLLVLLLGAAAFLWFTRPGESAIRTDHYAAALTAARSGVVDLTSFDYLTLDDDIEQARRVTTGDLREEAVGQLEDRRQEILDSQAVSNTEVVGAGVIRADAEEATVMLLIQSTQESTATPQPQILRYRIEVTLDKQDDRWLLSGITGTGAATDE